jgi:hypothetical protein
MHNTWIRLTPQAGVSWETRRFSLICFTNYIVTVYTAVPIKIVPEQSGKVEYEVERLARNR